MNWLNEWVFKLVCFFAIGYIFVLVDILFLSLTEDFPLRKMSFNIVDYFPLSYGIFLPILTFFCSHPYYPIGAPRYRDFPFHFDVEHTSNKFFSYLFLWVVFLLSLQFFLFSYADYNLIFLQYLWWFYEVFFTFLLVQLIPLYPTLMGVGILREVKRALLKQKKNQNIGRMILVAEGSSFFFIFLALTFNYAIFSDRLTSFLFFLLKNLNTSLYFGLLGVLLLVQFRLFYLKKREYNLYLKYIRNLLKEVVLKEKDTNH